MNNSQNVAIAFVDPRLGNAPIHSRWQIPINFPNVSSELCRKRPLRLNLFPAKDRNQGRLRYANGRGLIGYRMFLSRIS
jgi:hypothetical protein